MVIWELTGGIEKSASIGQLQKGMLINPQGLGAQNISLKSASVGRECDSALECFLPSTHNALGSHAWQHRMMTVICQMSNCGALMQGF